MLVRGGVASVVLGAAIAASVLAPGAYGRSASRCPKPATPATVGSDISSPIKLEVSPESDPLEIDFGGSRSIDDDHVISLKALSPLTGPARKLNARVRGNIRRVDKHKVFPTKQHQITLTPHVVSPREVEVDVCVDPEHPKRVEPGRYEGTVVVEADGVETTPVRIQITLRDSRSVLMLLLALAGATAGLIIKAAQDLVATKKKRRVNRTTFHEVVSWGLRIVSAIAAGAIAWWLYYTRNDTFGASGTDLVKMIGFGFGAAASGITITDLVDAALPFKKPDPVDPA
jgi:hypothetical protein